MSIYPLPGLPCHFITIPFHPYSLSSLVLLCCCVLSLILSCVFLDGAAAAIIVSWSSRPHRISFRFNPRVGRRRRCLWCRHTDPHPPPVHPPTHLFSLKLRCSVFSCSHLYLYLSLSLALSVYTHHCCCCSDLEIYLCSKATAPVTFEVRCGCTKQQQQ